MKPQREMTLAEMKTHNTAIKLVIDSIIPLKPSRAMLTKIRTLIKACPPSLTIEDISECEAAWEACLLAHKGPRKAFEWEREALGRNILRRGKEAVLLALLGAQHEKGNADFDPSEFCSMARIFDPLKFDRFVHLGAKAKNITVQRQAVMKHPEAAAKYMKKEDWASWKSRRS